MNIVCELFPSKYTHDQTIFFNTQIVNLSVTFSSYCIWLWKFYKNQMIQVYIF